MNQLLTSEAITALKAQIRGEQDRRNALARAPVDFPFYCELALKLRPKMGALKPMVLNPAQLKLHQIIEEQKARTGRVRVLILKARQLGVSTLVAARFFWRVTKEPGLRCYIVGHEKRASSNLFQIVKRYYDHLPPELQPVTSASSQEELIFAALDSAIWSPQPASTAPGDRQHRSCSMPVRLVSGPTSLRNLHRSFKPCPIRTERRSSLKAPRTVTMNSIRSGAKQRLETASFFQYFCPGRSIQNTVEPSPSISR